MDHNKIIAAAAKAALNPLGLKRDGRSRTWYDDHRWWAIIVEFQPSGHAKGTYLNVGVSWFLYEKAYWSFDIGYRQDDFSSARNAGQFEDEVQRVCALATEKVAYYRQLVGKLDDACACYATKSQRSEWDWYYAAILNALNGDIETAQAQFETLLAARSTSQRQFGLQYRVRDLLRLLDTPDAFRESIRGIVLRCRSGMNLDDIEPQDIQF